MPDQQHEPHPQTPARGHRAVLTVTVTPRPDGGHYFDQADFAGHVTEWVRAGLKGKHAVDEVTISKAPAVPSAAAPPTQADGERRQRIIQALYESRRHGLGGMTEAAAVAHMADVVLRRLAEAPQPETEAHPAEHTWAAELHDPLADEWVPGTRYLARDRAVNALAHARSIGPTWKDGTPTQRRLVRATTTYTVEVEQPATPEA